MYAVFFVGLAMFETRTKTSRYDKLYKGTPCDKSDRLSNYNSLNNI